MVAKNAKVDNPSVSTNNEKETISQITIPDKTSAPKSSSKSQLQNSQLDKSQTPKSQSQSPKKLPSLISPEMNTSDAEMERIIQDHFTLNESVTQLLKKSNKDTSNNTSKKMAKCKYCWWSLLQNTAQQYKHLMLNHKNKIVLGSGSQNTDPARSPPTSLPSTSGGSNNTSSHDPVQDNSKESTKEKNKSNNKDSLGEKSDANNRSVVILESDEEDDDGIVLDPRMKKPQIDVVSTTKKNIENQCNRCDLIFSNPYHNHKRYEGKPLQFCPVCSYKSCTGNGLGSHVRKEHPDIELVVESRKRKSDMIEEDSSTLTKLGSSNTNNITDDPNPDGDGQTKLIQNCIVSPPSKKSKVSQPEKETDAMIFAPNPDTLLPASKETTNSTDGENEAMARTLANLSSGHSLVAGGGEEQQPVSDQSVSSSSDALKSMISINEIKLEEVEKVTDQPAAPAVKTEENIKSELLLAEQSRTKSVTYQCEFCDKRFQDLMGIKSHVEDGHNVLFTNDGSHVVNPDSVVVPPPSKPTQNDSDEEHPEEEDDDDFPQMKIQSVETLKPASPVKPKTPEKPVNKCDKCDQGKKIFKYN